MRILGLIPARGGSKGVPHKNIIDINGKPLINYSIEVGLRAKEVGLIQELVVSTDDEEICEVAKCAGASVPFMRPDYLSNDTAKSVDVIIHALDFYHGRGIDFDAVLLLQPTTPLRSVEDIEKSIEIFNREKAKSLISCYKEEYICEFVSYHKSGNLALACNKLHNSGRRRQDEEDLYVRNGAIYLTKVDFINSEHKVFDDVPAMYVMSKEASINVDCMDDVELLRWRLSR